MSANDDMDVEQYKTEHECDEHWELRRKFLLAHKDKFPEDELVCLGQVFVNVELLGCRYPKETMELIAELSQDIVGDYRERQKSKLQRTFVKASDAASSKVKGLNAPRTADVHENKQNNPNKQPLITDSNETPSKKMKVENDSLSDIVLVEKPGDIPQNIISSALGVSGHKLQWKCDRRNYVRICQIVIDSKLIAEASGPNRKTAKREASIIGLRELQKHCYMIKIKKHVNEGTNVTTMTTLKDPPKDESISDDNIGKRLMKLMGWSGGGLGKSEQGIVEPVTVKQQISKNGLGLKSNTSRSNVLKVKAFTIMRRYMAGDMKKDLIFSADFSNEERATIHQVARYLGLKSHSYGPKNQRTLVISPKVNVRELVDELKSLGGVTDKYELIYPTEP